MERRTASYFQFLLLSVPGSTHTHTSARVHELSCFTAATFLVTAVEQTAA